MLPAELSSEFDREQWEDSLRALIRYHGDMATKDPKVHGLSSAPGHRGAVRTLTSALRLAEAAYSGAPVTPLGEQP